MHEELNYDELDPGIRDQVRMINELGFITTDSGDGVTKPPSPETLPFPHVAISTTEYRLIEDADRFRALADETVLLVGCKIEASFDPRDRSAIIFVSWQ